MHDFKLTQLRVFINIVDEGGFHAAAKKLHKSQPAISLAIKSLESNAGQALFEKRNHAKITSFGKEFYSHAKALVAHHDDIQLKLSQLNRQQFVSIKIATIPSVAEYLMPDLLKSFLKIHTQAKIHLIDTSSKQIKELIKERKIDIGILTIHDISTDFSTQKITQDQFGVVYHRNHPINKLKNIGWDDVADYNPIINGTWDILPTSLNNELRKISNMEIDNMSSLNAVLKSGLGITVLPQLAYSKSTDVVFHPLSEPPIFRHIGVIKDNHNNLSEITHQFCEHVINHHY